MAVAGALVTAPCMALAQTSVEVFGRITTAFGHVKYSQATDGSAGISKWDVMQGGPIWGLRGREDLGGELTAWFEISENAPMEQSNSIAATPASRNAGVGIRGPWGNVFVGSWYTPWAELDFLWSIGTVGTWGPLTAIIGRRETHGTAPNFNCANGHLSGGAVTVGGIATDAICDAVEAGGGVGHPFWRRISNAMLYHSPLWSGVQFKLGVQTNEGRASAGATAAAVAANPWMWSSSLVWSGMGGRARVGLAVDRHKDFTTVGATDSGWAVKGHSDFGIVNFGLAFERMTYRSAPGDVRAKQWGAALDFPIGGGSIKAAYASAADLSGGAGFRGTGARQYNVGYQHRFSKRTDVGIGYAAIQNDAAARFTWAAMAPVQSGGSNIPLAGSDVSVYFVTMTHRF